MEMLRRNIKIFWTEHGTPILFWTIVIIAVILIVQGLNRLAIKNSEKNSTHKNQINNVMQENIDKEDKTYTAKVNQFISYCKNSQIQEAYDMLSEKCKKELYPTINHFKNNYYSKMFNQGYDIEVEYNSNNEYKIKFYENILQSGKIENRNYIEDIYKIEEEILESKIYINIARNIK